MSVGTDLQKYTYAYLMNIALAQVSDTLDKREGSIIYDALAPACYVLADCIMQLYRVTQETYVETATGEYLDLRAAEYGITRHEATAAVKRGDFKDQQDLPMEIPEGSRFSTISTTVPVIYVSGRQLIDAEGRPIPGAYRMTCETVGTVGNEYTGNLTPISNIMNLKTATLSTTIVPASDTEDDETLRKRYIDAVNAKPFGGNVAQYREWMQAQDGVGAVQIYPVWNGGGTVKISVLDSSYNPITEEFQQELQQLIDPENYHGQGIGQAPIDHFVTIAIPTEVEINVNALLTLSTGIGIEQVQDSVEEAINNYLYQLRTQWANSDDQNRYALSVYVAQITAAILSVSGVVTVNNLTVNTFSGDLSLVETGELQQIPVLGEVTLQSSATRVDPLAVTCTKGSTVGTTHVEVTPTKEVDNTYVYQITQEEPILVDKNTLLESTQTWNGSDDIACSVGDYIVIYECFLESSGKYRALKGGFSLADVKEE